MNTIELTVNGFDGVNPPDELYLDSDTMSVEITDTGVGWKVLNATGDEHPTFRPSFEQAVIEGLSRIDELRDSP